MEYKNSIHHLISLIDRPAFCVKDGTIQLVNNAAYNLGIVENASIYDLLDNRQNDYTDFSGGALSCALCISGSAVTATVNRIDGIDYFMINEAQNPIFNSLALASQQLRKPLANIMALMDSSYMQNAANSADGATPVKQLNKSLMQLHRHICNMSDASLYTETTAPMSVVGIRGLFLQIMDKATTLLNNVDFKLTHAEPEQEVYTLTCSFLLERAIYNLISNAVKFAPKGSEIYAKLKKDGQQLRISVQSETTMVNPQLNFDMYKRTPSLEDSRLGMGLGMVMVRKAATIHNGTVLIDNPTPTSIRITMSLQIRDEENPTFRSHAFQYVDYSGGVDHSLLELSEILSTDCY